MVRVRLTTKSGKTWIASFPKKASLSDVRGVVKRANPKIVKVEYARKRRKTRTPFNFGFLK